MSKLLALTTLSIIITLTFNLNLIPYVNSSPEPSTPSSPEDIGDDYESNGSGEMNKGDLINKLDEKEVGDKSGLVDDTEIIQRYEKQDLIGDDEDNAGGESPTSAERGGNPLEGLNLGREWGKSECEKYLKSLGGDDDTSIGDTIENPLKTREEYCKGILEGTGGAGIDNTNTNLSGIAIDSNIRTDQSTPTEEEEFISEKESPYGETDSDTKDTEQKAGGNPLEGLNLAKSKLMAQCWALKQETKGTEIDVIIGEEKTLEEKCKELGI